ncbi:putative Pleiotropic ABC efflux transporter of multiple drugs [Glarea lozoyensis 74030]|uniref:Putative Pleiotropic ABC efflux transporter of multiple drugs n=1 Tax=Glarea lozoyensis (strain ATCC 74030 / MF5533) TaxID=1104152 RepID=H0EZI3_GLAL7|nr:putative Pleiotropic ABC efflux transporter of multiple drugs [Glarea lozoyensis 74030]
MLRQPKTTPYAEKITYVEKVISLIGMEKLADTVIEASGESLNSEQMKRLAIGVELAAKPTTVLLLEQPLSSVSCKTVASYFERHGARPCNADENLAEWMLEITSSTPEFDGPQVWSEIWKNSSEHWAIKSKLANLKKKFPKRLDPVNSLHTAEIFEQSAVALDAMALQRKSKPFHADAHHV